MLFITFRHAETALRAGRLDEAATLLAPAHVRAHRQGQHLLTQLVAALVERGRAHLAAGRLSSAHEDASRAQRLAGAAPDIQQLLSAISEAQRQQFHAQRQAALAVVQAQKQLEAGRLAAGERMLQDAVSLEATRAFPVRQEIHQRRATIESAIERATVAMNRNDYDVAAQALARVRKLDQSDRRLQELCSNVTSAILDQIHAALTEGRLDLALALGERLSRLGATNLEAEQALRTLEQLRSAWDAVDRGRTRQAIEILQRLRPALKGATWLDEVIGQIEEADRAMEKIRGSALSTISSAHAVFRDSATQKSHPLQPPPVPRTTGSDESAGSLPARFILQVDGAGSFLVLRSSSVTIGPISSNRLPDIGLVAEPDSALATIDRSDDDYFVRSTSAINVNDRPAMSRMLISGDRIALSARCRVQFVLPNPSSTTAAIDLVGARYPRSDVRRVILLDRDILIGPGPACHVRADHLTKQAVLLVKDGALLCQCDEPVTVDGIPIERTRPLPVGKPVTAGAVTFVVTVL